MNVYFKNKKLQKLFNFSELEKTHGKERAKKIKIRLAELEAAKNLMDFYPPKSKPARCHELIQGKSGKEKQLSVDLDHPYRLIFVPNHDPIPLLSDGGLDWEKVTAITIVDIQILMNNLNLYPYEPDYAVSPGEVLSEYLESYEMTQTELAQQLELPQETINAIIEAQIAIAPEIATKLQKVFQRPAHFWINLQDHYEQTLIRLEQRKSNICRKRSSAAG